jgi:hypothetical protein
VVGVLKEGEDRLDRRRRRHLWSSLKSPATAGTTSDNVAILRDQTTRSKFATQQPNVRGRDHLAASWALAIQKSDSD